MTRDEILNMPAGREMDSLIAKYVIEVPDARGVYRFSADIYDAWMVVSTLGMWKDFDFIVHLGVDGWEAGWVEFDHEGYEHRYACYAKTPALAICRAALLAVMEYE